MSGLCEDPGPDSAHCDEFSGHLYSCYDATRDTSWNSGQFADGWFDDTPHACERPRCPGRALGEVLSNG